MLQLLLLTCLHIQWAVHYVYTGGLQGFYVFGDAQQQSWEVQEQDFSAGYYLSLIVSFKGQIYYWNLVEDLGFFSEKTLDFR